MDVYEGSKCAVFYTVLGAWGGLSNFAPSRIGHKGIAFATAEHLYQAAKFAPNERLIAHVASAPTPREAKRRAYEGRADWRRDWEARKRDVMLAVLRLKFEQNPEALALLRRTGTMPIVERSSRDTYWGAIPCGNGQLRGENVLGKLLMQVREELRGAGR